MNRNTGMLLEIYLEQGTMDSKPISLQLYREYLGGYGLGCRLLMDRMDPAADPLGPENIMGMAAGCLTGTGALIGSRYMVFGKSPSTGGWGDANCGGFFGKKLRNSGFDCLLLHGISYSPVYLLIDDGKAELRDASHLWGKDTYETEDILKAAHGKDSEVACIGPAGENLSVIAGICTDKGRYAARSGLGAVMGSKKLKAVVVKGKAPIPVADPGSMKVLRKKYLSVFKEEFPSLLSKYGTPIFYNEALHAGDAPVKNWSSSVQELHEPDSMTEETFRSFEEKKYGCSGCPIACGAKVRVADGPFKTETEVHQVEYETIGMFGPNLLVQKPDALIKINDLCNRYGLDTISCGGLCAFAVECYENGIITEKDTGGLELTWGNAEAVTELVGQICRQEGLGTVLARGFDHAVEAFGKQSAQYAMAIRNEGFPAHDPRWGKDLALTYYTDATPARHTQGSNVFPAAGYDVSETAATDERVNARCHINNASLNHAMSSAGLCLFGYSVLDYHAVPEFLQAVLRVEYTAEELIQAGLRIHMIRHLFNLKAGVQFHTADFPARVLGKPPLASGENKGVSINLESMVAAYMEELDLERDTSAPANEVLAVLNL